MITSLLKSQSVCRKATLVRTHLTDWLASVEACRGVNSFDGCPATKGSLLLGSSICKCQELLDTSAFVARIIPLCPRLIEGVPGIFQEQQMPAGANAIFKLEGQLNDVMCHSCETVQEKSFG